MSSKKRFAAYGMAATAAIGGGIGGLAVGVGLPPDRADLATLPAELAAASPGAATPVHIGRGGGTRVDHLGVAAEALGMPVEELRSALQGGKSVAQVAADRKVEVQKVIDALVAAHNTALDQAVTDGRLTQAQADERKAGLADRIKAVIERTGLRGPGGPGRGGLGKVDDIAVAAQALGMPAEELRTALRGGKSIAQVAGERNVDLQKVIDAVVAADTAALDQAVRDGRITQAQADERKAGLAARVKAHVERVGLRGPGGPGKGHHGPGGFGGRGGAGAPAGGTSATPSAVVVD